MARASAEPTPLALRGHIKQKKREKQVGENDRRNNRQPVHALQKHSARDETPFTFSSLFMREHDSLNPQHVFPNHP